MCIFFYPSCRVPLRQSSNIESKHTSDHNSATRSMAFCGSKILIQTAIDTEQGTNSTSLSTRATCARVTYDDEHVAVSCVPHVFMLCVSMLSLRWKRDMSDIDTCSLEMRIPRRLMSAKQLFPHDYSHHIPPSSATGSRLLQRLGVMVRVGQSISLPSTSIKIGKIYCSDNTTYYRKRLFLISQQVQRVSLGVYETW